MTVRVRIAPSPTGDPHIGTAYIGLINKVFAQQQGGRFILRIEDTDQSRCTPTSEAMIYEALRWVGIQWDEGPDCGGDFGPYRQSERSEIYRQYAQKLVDEGKAYPCFCTPEDLAALRAEQIKAKGWVGYDGRYRDLDPAEAQARIEAGESYVIRFRVNREETTIVHDLLRDPIEFANKEVDDQVLIKSDGFPTYHLANVVDDHLMEISHVIRGEEWITSTPKHVMLYEAFGWKQPVFCHVPLLRNPDKSKVSKRKNPVSLNYYRDAGILPEAMRNYLARMAWSFPVDEGEETREKFSFDEMVEAFSLERITLGGPVFDMAKLSWLNGRYIREDHSPEALWERLREYFMSDERWAEIVPLVHERMDRLDEFMPQVAYFFSGDLDVEAAALKPKKKTLEELEPVFSSLVEKIDQLIEWNEESIETLLRGHCVDTGWKPRDLFMPIRIAVTGRKATPGMWETLAVLGKERTRRRLREALKKIKAANRA